MKTAVKTTTAKVFLTDYASYNNGSQFEFGHWVDLSDFGSAEELEEYITKHLEECDKKSPLGYGAKREEPMFTDYEGFPASLYLESNINFEAIYNYLEVAEELENYNNYDWVILHNQFSSNTGASEDEIYSFDDDFFETYFGHNPIEAARATHFGDVNWSDEWICFDGYANLKSINEYSLKDYLDKDQIIEHIIENREDYYL